MNKTAKNAKYAKEMQKDWDKNFAFFASFAVIKFLNICYNKINYF
uniref:Uncharacterized protein n=1 Tax=uncultured bacterium contig00100 TaxID=1181567 RepID=A0A806KCX1_9BACT|nr:hypothetical protein [uncultured bacterium contig00100]